MSSVFVSGNSGRVSVGGSPVAGLKSWKMTKTTKAVQLLHFESQVDGQNNVWEDQLVGASSAKVSGEGYIDTNPSTATDAASGGPGLYNGAVVTMSLILVKGTPWGFNQVSVQIDQYEVASAIDSDKPATFSFSGSVKGAPGLTTTVTG
jgi:hypothetical protein